VDWRMKKARERHEKGIAQIERELDAFLRTPREAAISSGVAPAAETAAPVKPPPSDSPRPRESSKSNPTAVQALTEVPETAQAVSAAMEIPPAIKNHVQSLPQGVFHNMDLEVEAIKLNGDNAEADVRFRSPNVTGLVIRQRYVMRKSGEGWEVESRQPTNGASKAPPHAVLPGPTPMTLT